ncbi:hypothetical protein [uncultured Roseobacter sp.]|uniref:hypothetical protein n=1 Tax=uncultured Roseobacter sp. TaxID=114847 RepID=UPI002627C6A6|nr:hypothetical protein [uncultured Roseobacter sp.]
MERLRSSTSSSDVALKIYGERNTGTNYLTALMDQNLCAEVLPGHVDGKDLRTQLTRRLHRALPGLARGLHEAARDRYFEATFARNLGWKHMNPDVARIGADALSSVRFLMVVKNPYSWLLSLFQRPYHVGGKDTRFEEFLERHLGVMEQRENIGRDPLSPVEVWNRKMRGYQVLKAAAKHAMIVRYEDFLEDEAAALERVATQLGITLRGTHIPITGGVKHADGELSHKDYATYYLQEKWRDRLSKSALERINAELDPDLVTRLGYQMISPDQPPYPTA